MNLEAVVTLLGGAGAATVVIKVLDVFAGRRGSVVSADVALSAEARAWAERFSKGMDDMAARHAVDIAALRSQVDSQAKDIADLRERLTERESRIRVLEVENGKLEKEVARLTARVRVLEGGKDA